MTHPGREVVQAAKAAATAGEPAFSLPIGRPVAGLLRPVVTRPTGLARADVDVLTAWRNRFAGAFLTEFEATAQRTERWLVDGVGPDDSRILFMVEDAEGRTVGHMGLAFIDWEAGSAEADAVVRGGEAPPGLMTRALETMWRWGRSALGLTTLRVRVRSDNPALAFYEQAGFRETRRVPLRRVEVDGGARWEEHPAGGDVSLVHLELEPHGV